MIDNLMFLLWHFISFGFLTLILLGKEGKVLGTPKDRKGSPSKTAINPHPAVAPGSWTGNFAF
jgi:hypothetical protein